MARVTVTPVNSLSSGTVVANAAITTRSTFVTGTNNGITFDNANADCLVIVKHTAQMVLTIPQPNPQDGVASPGKVLTCLANQEYVLGPFQKGVYNDSSGMVSIDADVAGTYTVVKFAKL